MIEENVYLKDKKFCIECRKEASFECPYCISFKIKAYYCSKCALTKTNKPNKYCIKCNQKLHPIALRFVGSIRPMQKFDGKELIKKPEAPTIYPISDRQRMQRGEKL